MRGMGKPIQYETNLTEFTYTIARQAPLSLRRLLPERIFRAINSEQGAMKFAAKSTFDQKREFFTYLGVEHFTIFIDTKRGANDFRDVFKQFDTTDKPTDMLRKMGDLNVYVSSNKEFAYLLGLMSRLVESTAYSRNMELIRTSYHFKKLKAKINVQEYKESLEERDANQHFAKVIGGVLWANDFCEEVSGIDKTALRVLLYFYINRQLYISQESLISIFNGSISGRMVAAARRRLVVGQLIQKHGSQQKNEYIITARGILVVNQFRDKVIKSLDF